jgi:hypothetical protein
MAAPGLFEILQWVGHIIVIIMSPIRTKGDILF